MGTDITLDDVLNRLDEHYNNVKALDALNQELFQMHMGKKEIVLDWRVHLLRHLQILAVSFLECFPPDQVAKLKCDHFYGRLPKWLKAMVAFLKASAHEKTYSNYLRAAREAEKPKATSLFPLQKLKGTQPTKIPAIRAVHLEEEGSKDEAGAESKDPDGIEGVTEEFIVHLVRVVKETQKDEKWCYYCNSTDHFIHEFQLVKASRSATHLNQKEGMALEKGAQPSQVKVTKPKAPQEGMPKA